MRTIQIKEPFKYNETAFLTVRKASNLYRLHESYTILDECGRHVTRAFIHSLKEITLDDIDNEISTLAINSSSDIFKEVLKYRGINETDKLYKIVFSTQRPKLDYD